MKKGTISDKLSVMEGLIILLLLASYGCSLYFSVINNRPYFVLSFALYTCLSILFVLVVHDKMTRAVLQQNGSSFSQFEDEIAALSRRDEEISLLKKEKNSLLAEKEQLAAKYKDAEKQISTLTASLEQEKNRQENAAEASDLYHLLPQNENPVPLDIIACASRVIEEMTPYSRQSGIQIQLSSACDSLTVQADASFIRIMFRNIIDNSIKYMNRNGSLVITISNIGDDLFIVLKDNGEGLPAAETTHIFELNYQGSNRVSGNGLGLTQAKAIVEYYGGTIYARSEPGKGMGIYIQLPAKTR